MRAIARDEPIFTECPSLGDTSDDETPTARPSINRYTDSNNLHDQKEGSVVNVVFEKNPLPTFLYDLRSFALHAANEAALYQYGYTEQEFLSLTLPQLAVHPQQQPPPSLSIETPDIPGGTRFRARHRRKDGTLFDVEIVSHLIRWKR